MTDDTAPGQRVQAEREARGWSRSECERALGLHSGQLVGIERGERGVSVDTAARIEDVLGVPVRAWVGAVPRRSRK